MVTRNQREVNANGLVECGRFMFHLGAPVFSLLSVTAHTRQPPPDSLLPNQAHAFFAAMVTDPDKTGAIRPGESKRKAQAVNVADANGLLMVVAKFVLWQKTTTKCFTICCVSKYF